MSLVGFQARNHPQQVAAGGAKLHVDDMATPPELFDPLDARFGFTLDACATYENAKCPRYFARRWEPRSQGCVGMNGLEQSWQGERVWCNPPYSDIEPWVEKASAEASTGRHRALVVMLLPANRTEQGWWQRKVEPHRDRSGPIRVEFLPGRPRFIRYEDGIVRPNERPPFGCCLLIWDTGREQR